MKKLTIMDGTDLSSWSREKEQQENCIALVSGVVNSDGSFDAYAGSGNWITRLTGSEVKVHIAKEDVLSVTYNRSLSVGSILKGIW